MKRRTFTAGILATLAAFLLPSRAQPKQPKTYALAASAECVAQFGEDTVRDLLQMAMRQTGEHYGEGLGPATIGCNGDRLEIRATVV